MDHSSRVEKSSKVSDHEQIERYPRKCGAFGFNWGVSPFMEKEYTSEDFKKDAYVSASVKCECRSPFSSSSYSDACKVEEIPKDWFLSCDETEYEVKKGRGTEGMSFLGDNPICKKKEGKCEFGSPYEHHFVDGVCTMKTPLTCRDGTVRTRFVRDSEKDTYNSFLSNYGESGEDGICRWMDAGIVAFRKDDVGNGVSMPDKVEFGFQSEFLKDGAHALFHLEEGDQCTFAPSSKTKRSVPSFQVRKRGNESTLEVVIGKKVTSIKYNEGEPNLVRWEYEKEASSPSKDDEEVEGAMREDKDKKWTTRVFLNDELVHQEKHAHIGTKDGKQVQLCAPPPKGDDRGGLVLSQPMFHVPDHGIDSMIPYPF